MRTFSTTIRLVGLLAALGALALAPAARAQQPSANVYAAANGAGTIDAYGAGADGALTALGAPAPTGGRPTAVAVAPDGRSLYATNQLAHTIAQYSVADDGTLTPKDPAVVDAGEAPFGLAVAPDGGHVYVADQATGDVLTFAVGAGGALAAAGSARADDGAAAIALTPDGANAYVVNVDADSVSQFAVAADGSLTPRGAAPVPAGVVPSAVAVAPDGASAYVTDKAATGSVLQFDVLSDGTLAAKTPARVGAGRGPAGVVATRDSVYVADSGDGQLSQYDVAADGTLSAKAPATVAAGQSPQALALAPDGASLYAGNYGDNTISQYDVAGDGTLAPKASPTVPVGALPAALAARAAPDVTSPTVDLVTPADGATYAEDDTVLARYTCADEGPSGLASCEGTVPDGDPIDTSRAGDFTFAVVARDGAGNETRVEHHYTVTGESTPPPDEVGWAGFAWPVRGLPAVNWATAGDSTLVKFRLTGADDLDPSDVVAEGSPSSVQVDCDDPGAPREGEPARSVDDRGLTRGRPGTFRFAWATDASWEGTCRMLLVELSDGSVHRALFAFDSPTSWRG